MGFVVEFCGRLEMKRNSTPQRDRACASPNLFLFTFRFLRYTAPPESPPALTPRQQGGPHVGVQLRLLVRALKLFDGPTLAQYHTLQRSPKAQVMDREVCTITCKCSVDLRSRGRFAALHQTTSTDKQTHGSCRSKFLTFF